MEPPTLDHTVLGSWEYSGVWTSEIPTLPDLKLSRITSLVGTAVYSLTYYVPGPDNKASVGPGTLTWFDLDCRGGGVLSRSFPSP